MNIYEVLVVAIFVIITIIMICQYINSEVRTVCEVLQVINILPCYGVKAFKNGKRIKNSELIKYINSPVKAYEMKDDILYIDIY